MAVFELVLALLLGGAGLALLAPRLGVPWPALLALAGAALAFVPGVPEAALEPGLALALFVARLLRLAASGRLSGQLLQPSFNLAALALALAARAGSLLSDSVMDRTQGRPPKPAWLAGRPAYPLGPLIGSSFPRPPPQLTPNPHNAG